MTNPSEPSSKVLFRVPNEDGTSEVETLWAFNLGANRYKIDNLPFFAYGVSLHDIVFAPFDEEEGFATFHNVESKSGNRTVRVILDTPESDHSRQLRESLLALGVEYEGANKSYLVLNIPTTVPLDLVTQRLTAARVQWEHADPTWDQLHPNDA